MHPPKAFQWSLDGGAPWSRFDRESVDDELPLREDGPSEMRIDFSSVYCNRR